MSDVDLGQGHFVATRMSDRFYEAVCTCGWAAERSTNWVVVSSAIVSHFNTHILDR